MADHASARTFSEVFQYLAACGKTIDRDEFADILFRMMGKKDFHPCQMSCDASLIALGLARRRGEEMEYGRER